MKPSDRIAEIYGHIRGKDDSEKDSEAISAIILFLDEQSEKEQATTTLLEATEAVGKLSDCFSEMTSELKKRGLKEQASEGKLTYTFEKPIVHGTGEKVTVTDKPQEEQKCERMDCVNTYTDGKHTCHYHILQKESESKNFHDIDSEDRRQQERHNAKYIVLPRPKGMSIGEALKDFHRYMWRHNTESPISDQTFLKLWQEWLTSLEK